MRICSRVTTLLLLFCAALPFAHAQGDDTAGRQLQLYVFGGGTVTYTGLAGGRNAGFTAGLDIGLKTYRGFLPTLEVRGSEPFDDGTIDAQKNFLGGIKVERRYRTAHPYIDVLYGRGQIDYAGAGYLNPQQTILYQRTNSNIYAFGGGLDYDLTNSFALKVDAQLQHYVVPVTTSGDLYAKAITIGVVYRIGYRNTRPTY